MKDLAKLITSKCILCFGDYTLKDGRPSPYYLDMGRASDAKSQQFLGSLLARKLVQEKLVDENSVLVGPSYKGVPLAQSCALALEREHSLNTRFDYDRKEEKKHGDASRHFVNRAFFKGCNAIVIDDVISSMETKEELIEKIKKHSELSGYPIPVRCLLAVIDREMSLPAHLSNTACKLEGERGADPIREFEHKSGIPVHTLTTASKIITQAYERQLPLPRKRDSSPIRADEWEAYLKHMDTYGLLRGGQGPFLTQRGLIAALDTRDLGYACTLAEQLDKHVIAYKIGFDLALTHSLPRTVQALRDRTRKPIIYDHQKAGTDVPHTAQSFAQLMKSSRVDAAILFPRERDYQTQIRWTRALQNAGLGVLVGGELSSRDASDNAEHIYTTAALCGVRDFIVPGTKPGRIRHYAQRLGALCERVSFCAPGYGAQGGIIDQSLPVSPIVGRTILNDPDQARRLNELLL